MTNPSPLIQSLRPAKNPFRVDFVALVPPTITCEIPPFNFDSHSHPPPTGLFVRGMGARKQILGPRYDHQMCGPCLHPPIYGLTIYWAPPSYGSPDNTKFWFNTRVSARYLTRPFLPCMHMDLTPQKWNPCYRPPEKIYPFRAPAAMLHQTSGKTRSVQPVASEATPGLIGVAYLVDHLPSFSVFALLIQSRG